MNCFLLKSRFSRYVGITFASCYVHAEVKMGVNYSNEKQRVLSAFCGIFAWFG
jgi:hypothetical protein